MKKEENGNQKRGIGNRTSVRILLVGIVLCSLVIVPVTAAKLATPTIISPVNNYHAYNLDVLVTWKPVPGALFYKGDLQAKVGSDWVDIAGFSAHPSCYWSLTGIGSGIFRYRVMAWNGNPVEDSAYSSWRTYDAIPHPQSLTAPTPIGPPSGAVFYHTPRQIRFEWKPVMGANQYQVKIERYNVALKSWEKEPFTPITVSGTLNTVYDDLDFSGPFKGRWCVVAKDTTGAWADSKYSTWRTFEFKN